MPVSGRRDAGPSFASIAIGSGGMISTVSNPMARQPVRRPMVVDVRDEIIDVPVLPEGR